MLKMNKKIDNPVEVRSVIRFLKAELMPRGTAQRRILLCNSVAETARYSKPTSGSVVKRRGAPAQQCCFQNASSASGVWLGR